MTNSVQTTITNEIAPAKKYIAYYRVSTQKQGASGLGLDSQKSIVNSYLGSQINSELISEFCEIESGKKSNRTELNKAIEICKKSGACLIIAKLDRLSRDVEFLFKLKNSGIEIKACDLSDFNTLTLGIFATMAQHERELISTRTKNALNELKKKGVKLGNPNFENSILIAQKKGVQSIKDNAANNENNIKARALINSLRENGLNWNKIAKKLNELGFKTSKGGEFSIVQVQRLAK